MVFAALAETHGVTGAAGRLLLSQPAVSRALKRLRTTFGDDLLIRTPGGYEPTSRGEALLAELTMVQPRLERLIAGPSFDPGRDAVTTRPSGFTATSSIATTSSVWRRARVATRGGSPCDSTGRSPRRRERAPGTEDHRRPAPGRVGERRTWAIEVPFFTAALRCVASTNMLATVPRCLAELERHPALKLLEAPPEISGFAFLMLWHPRRETDPAHAWLRGVVRAAGETLSARKGNPRAGRRRRNGRR